MIFNYIFANKNRIYNNVKIFLKFSCKCIISVFFMLYLSFIFWLWYIFRMGRNLEPWENYVRFISSKEKHLAHHFVLIPHIIFFISSEINHFTLRIFCHCNNFNKYCNIVHYWFKSKKTNTISWNYHFIMSLIWGFGHTKDKGITKLLGKYL